MSEKHLAAGSTEPPLEPGKYRLYSMKFCPFSQRARMVLIAKNIPHDIVNIDLKNKPEWLVNVNPQRKVPALNTQEQVITESLDIADFLEEEFPDPPLYPSRPEKKEKDKQIIQEFAQVVNAYSSALYKDKDTAMENTDVIFEVLSGLNEELKSRETTFFGGDRPGMVDYMIWPWAERWRVPSALAGKDVEFPKDQFKNLVVWKREMKTTKPVQETFIELDTHVKFLNGYFSGNPNYEV